MANVLMQLHEYMCIFALKTLQICFTSGRSERLWYQERFNVGAGYGLLPTYYVWFLCLGLLVSDSISCIGSHSFTVIKMYRDCFWFDHLSFKNFRIEKKIHRHRDHVRVLLAGKA